MAASRAHEETEGLRREKRRGKTNDKESDMPGILFRVDKKRRRAVRRTKHKLF